MKTRNLSPLKMFMEMAARKRPRFHFPDFEGNFPTWKTTATPLVLQTLGEWPDRVAPDPELVAEWVDRGVRKRRYLIDVAPHSSAALQVNLPENTAEPRPGDSGLSQITWEQAVATENAPFELKVVTTKSLKPGSIILTLFDADKRMQTHLPSNNPKDFVLYPELYSVVLQKGAWALKTSLAVPDDSGFEPLRELETQATFQFEIQKRLDRIRVLFDALDHDKVRLLIASESRVREVERKAKANGGESIFVKRWKKQKDQLTSEIPLSGEGSALFTDGEYIYQVAPGRMKNPELKIYAVEKNRLSR